MATTSGGQMMTDPGELRDYGGRFSVHADIVDDESRRAFASSESIAGGGWFGGAQTMSHGTMEEIMRAFRNIREMLDHTSQTMMANADEYERIEAENRAALQGG